MTDIMELSPADINSVPIDMEWWAYPGTSWDYYEAAKLAIKVLP